MDERLQAVDALGSWQPTQLLAEMMELYPDDEEGISFCSYTAFSLGFESCWRMTTTTTSGGWLQMHKQAGSVAMVQRGGQRSGQQGSQNSGQQHGGAGAKSMMLSEAAAAAAGFCWNHWRFAAKASSC